MEIPEVKLVDRIVIFIDGANLLAGIKRSLGDNFRYDIFKLVRFLKGSRKLVRAYYYDGIYPYPAEHLPPQTREHFIEERKKKEDFVKILRGKGITARLTELRVIRVKEEFLPIQKGVDVRLATDALTLGFRNAYDVAVFVSGDGDLSEVMYELKALGKQVEVASFKETMSEVLWDSADRVWLLEEFQKEIELQGKDDYSNMVK